MKRVRWLAVLAWGVCLAVGAEVQAQSGPRDRITYLDANRKAVTAEGVIQEETPQQIVYKVGSGNRVEKIPAVNLVDVEYAVPLALQGNVTASGRAQKKFEEAQTEEERKAAFQEALPLYQNLMGKLATSPNALRHLEFKRARMYARLAEDDPTQQAPAVQALGKFVRGNPDAWQLPAAAKLLGGLQEATGDLAGAQNTYESLSRRKDLPDAVRQDADLLVVRTLIRNNQTRQAEQKLTAMSKALAADDPKAIRLKVHLAECKVASGDYAQAEAQLREVLRSDADDALKGLAFNALGDSCRLQGEKDRARLEDAFWNYLWVDAVYSQDKHEHAKALYYLSKLFDQVRNDPVKAQQCRERLLNDKQFLGLDYQKRALREK